jgi:LacI family transcriptional regulator
MNTVKQDFVKISEEALSELERLMNGEEGRKVILPHTLVRLKYEDIIR